MNAICLKGDANDDYPHRRYERIIAKNAEWLASGADPKKLKDCRNIPLELFPSYGDPIEDIPPSSFHLKLRITNQMFDGLIAVFSEASAWPEQLGIKKAQYHGGQFEGRDCDRLLSNIDSL